MQDRLERLRAYAAEIGDMAALRSQPALRDVLRQALVIIADELERLRARTQPGIGSPTTRWRSGADDAG